MRFSIAWLEAMRLRGLSSHDTLGLAVQILSSSLCDCKRQFCSLVPPMPVRCGLQPLLALALSGIFSSFRGSSSAEHAVSRKVFLRKSYFRSCNRCIGMTSGGVGSLVSGRLWLRLIQVLYTASSSRMRFSWPGRVQIKLGCPGLAVLFNFGEPLPLVADAPIAIDINLLQELFIRDRLASFDSMPQDPRLASSAGVKLCTYHRWFERPQNAACPSYWESPMENAKMHQILRLRIGSHCKIKGWLDTRLSHLPIYVRSISRNGVISLSIFPFVRIVISEWGKIICLSKTEILDIPLLYGFFEFQCLIRGRNRLKLGCF